MLMTEPVYVVTLNLCLYRSSIWVAFSIDLDFLFHSFVRLTPCCHLLDCNVKSQDLFFFEVNIMLSIKPL